MNPDKTFSRRSALKTVAATSALTATGLQAAKEDKPFRIKNGRIRQSIMGWTFNPMPTMELAKLCKEIGLEAMEGVNSKYYKDILDLGLKISLVSSHGFKKGPINKKNHTEIIATLKKQIDLAKEVGAPGVITFTGMSEPDISAEEGAKNCVDCWKAVIPYAEKQGINLVLEHLNSRDDSHPMKGHPGYFGDDVDFCVELIKQVDSPRMTLLFDVYHIQIMNGDVIRRINKYKDYISHYHTAGNPGRAELDENQEINYPAIMRAILETGYKGYVAQEFIPTWDDKAAALRHAAEVCDV